MPKIDAIAQLAGYNKEDFSVCLGCKICGSVCTINDLSVSANPQTLLLNLFLQKELTPDDPVLLYCTNCYNCTSACPWRIRIPEIVRAVKGEMGLETPFEKAFKSSIGIWGRVYEPYVFLKALLFLVRGGYLAYMTKWTEYINFHLPHKVKNMGILKSKAKKNGKAK
jgi:heterodisulfide reductase subunit C